MFRQMLLQVIANAAAVIGVAYILPREVEYFGNFQTVAIFALLLGLLNAVLTPVLNLITWPLACLTFGLFRFVVNVAVFWLAVWILPSGLLRVTILGSVVASLAAAAAGAALMTLLRDER